MAGNDAPVSGPVGIVCNPYSGQAKKQLPQLRTLAAALPDGIYREAADHNAFGHCMDEFVARGIGLLVVIGGDGTFHGILSRIMAPDGLSAPVPLVLVPAGTTNMTARAFQINKDPCAVLQWLEHHLKNATALQFRSRPVLSVVNADNAVVCGMFFGSGIIADGVVYCTEQLRGSGLAGELGSALVLLRFLCGLAGGRHALAMRATDTGIRVDNGAAVTVKTVVLLASVLDRLLLGSRPYWGSEPAPMHLTLLQERPAQLWRHLLPILRGRGGKAIRPAEYRSHNCHAVELLFDGPFVIDGEIYHASTSDGPVKIDTGKHIDILHIP